MNKYLTILLLLTCKICIGQVDDQTIRQQVLEKGLVDSLFIFGKWDSSGQTETHLKYLGQVTTTDGETYKVMTSSWFWGLSHRATNRILIYNDKNKFHGAYGVTMTYDLPDKLENGKLIFTNTSKKDCDANFVTKVDLRRRIPTTFYLRCTKDSGDYYSIEPK